MNKLNNIDVGMNLSALVGTVFTLLKITGVINWPWLWVLSPFWMWMAVILTSVLVIALFMAVTSVLGRKR